MEPRSRPLAPRALGAAMHGLHEAMYGPRDNEAVIVVPAPGDPPDQRFRIELGATPQETRITLRPADSHDYEKAGA